MFFPPIAAWNIRGFNHYDKVLCFKRLIQSHKLDLVCILENRINSNSLLDPYFESSHSLYANEANCNNFDFNTSGRIWIKWNASKINFTPTFISSQVISGTIWVANQALFQLSAIYASNSSLERKDLWKDIAQLAPAADFPWAIMGDFNCCRYANEKFGGTAITLSSLLDFNNMIFTNCLTDLHSVGFKYTWYNQRSVNPIHIKLDRVLVNEGWLNKFTDSYCSIQSPAGSDHCPIILHSGLPVHVNHRFIFKNYWTKLDKFWSILLDASSAQCSGNPLSHFCNTMKTIKGEIKKQVWHSSSAVTRHMEALYKEQEVLLGKLQEEPNNNYINLKYREITVDIAKFNNIHASWIIQRAKVNWIRNGEEDLKFLYAKIRIRRGTSNSVVNLLTNNACSSRSDVVKSLIHYFQGLYNPLPPPNLVLDCFPVGVLLSQNDSHNISSNVLDEEIKKAVFSGSSIAAPGPDGFNFHFFKSAWHIIGPSVCSAIKSFFLKGYMPNGVKATALAIIPKHKNATAISDYRPIALCNVIYKIVAKVLAGRLKPVMNLIVMDNQAGFVKSRISTDNILLANEVLYFAGKSRCKKSFCAKLDIKKAFDSVSREFLLARLVQKGFPNTFINWIKACISDVNYSVVLNGALEGYFSTSAGLRQGCPLSPYLFCLVMDAFSNLLESRGFRGIVFDQYSLTHLLYADDVLIFGEATEENCNILVNILQDFADTTGLQVNHGKSAIMFPRNQDYSQAICNTLGIHNIVSKITYLGIPLSFYRLKIEDFLPLMDNVNKKMNGWKANLLSFAGRLQYIKFTIQNTIAYWIRGAIIPKSVYKFIKKTSSRFLFFGDTTTAKKLHMVSWDKICKPKSKGGLGIPSINAMQFAYNCSVIFRMYNSSSPLSNWLLYQYKSPWRPLPNQASKIWRSICKTAAEVKLCFNFRITHNSPISFFWDHWYNNTSIAEILGGISTTHFRDLYVKEVISGVIWALPDYIPLNLKNMIAGSINIEESGPCLLWKNHNTHNYKSYLEEYYSEFQNCSWFKMVWGKRHILRFSVFAWLALVNGLKTADALLVRNIMVPGTCSLCLYHNESVSHLFFECPYTFAILTALIPGTKSFLLRPSIMQVLDWVKVNNQGNEKVKNFYFVIVCSIIYHIWKERNGRRFGSTSNCSNTLLFNIKRNICEKAIKWGNSWDLAELL